MPSRVILPDSSTIILSPFPDVASLENITSLSLKSGVICRILEIYYPGFKDIASYPHRSGEQHFGNALVYPNF